MTTRLGQLVGRLRRQTAPRNPSIPGDAELLARFAAVRDEAAFTALVERHGPMVLALCRRRLGDPHEAEDACQATFLVLARRASALGRPGSLAGWLYAVAWRVTSKLHTSARRRRAREDQVRAMTQVPPTAPGPDDLRDFLDQALSRLPEKYRAPLVLCYLEGKTQEEAAQALGWPRRIVKCGVARGLSQLRGRLAGQCPALAPAVIAAMLCTDAPASMPAGLTGQIVAGALSFTTGEASGPTAGLANAVLRTMLVARWRTGAAWILFLAMTALGGKLLCTFGMGSPPHEVEPSPIPVADPALAERTDGWGDPLPYGAVNRLGTQRFRHAELIQSAAFSPDGKILATATTRDIALWQMPDGQLLRRHVVRRDKYSQLAFAEDGRGLITTEPDGSGHFFDVATGKELHSIPESPDAGLLSARSTDGRWTVIVDEAEKNRDDDDFPRKAGNTIRVRDANGKQVRQLEGHAQPVCALTFADGGPTLASADQSGEIRTWNVATGELLSKFRRPGRMIELLTFSNRGKNLFCVDQEGSYKGAVALLDPATGRELHSNWIAGGGGVVTATLLPDGSTAGVCTAEGHNGTQVILWDVHTGEKVRILTGFSSVAKLSFGPGNKTLATFTRNNVCPRLWDLESGRELFPQGHRDTISSLAFSPDGKTIASASVDGTVRLWDVNGGRELRCLIVNQNSLLLAFGGGGRFLAAAHCQDQSVRLWETESWRQLPSLSTSLWPPANTAGFAPEGDAVALGEYSNQERWVRVLHLPDGKELAHLSWPSEEDAPAVALSPGGKTVAVLTRESPARLVDVATGNLVQRSAQLPEGSHLVFSPEGKTAALTGGKTIHLIDLASGRTRWNLPDWGFTYSFAANMAFSPDGKLLAMGDAEVNSNGGKNGVRLVELATGQVVRSLAGHTDRVEVVAFSPDGKLLASAGPDTTILLWDVFSGRAAPSTAAEVSACWEELRSPEASVAQAALGALLRTPDRTVALVRERLQPAVARNNDAIVRLVADLNSPQFATRERASAKLEAVGEQARVALTEALAGNPTLEFRQRAESLLTRLDGPVLTPERLQAIRTVQLLEQIGSTEACRVLTRLAEGAPNEELTREARSARDRLARRREPR